jgi:transcriptional regulator of acetoin/glycerol metabolism
MEYEWPGNIRELENAVEHALILCHGGLIELRHLPEPLRRLGVVGTIGSGIRETLEEMGARAIREALARNNGRRTAAARDLGINKTTLWRKLKQFNAE